MRKIVLDIPSGIHARNMERMLMQKLDDCQIIISASPDETAEWCKTHRPDVLLMEVKAYSPWMFGERMKIRDRVKKTLRAAALFCLWMTRATRSLPKKYGRQNERNLSTRFCSARYWKTTLLPLSTACETQHIRALFYIFQYIFRRNSSWLTLVQSAEHPSTFSSLKSSRTETISAVKLAVKKQCATLIL